jgi:proline iminopeptidase
MSRCLQPKISPYDHQFLSVTDGYQLYVEQSGNPNGIPVLYLHGGPGGGCSDNHRRYFDPEKYRIILFDQRGCGRSTPSPCIDNNNLDKLLDDIEAIRNYLGIHHWLIAGGSWGTTLALVYGIRYHKRVLGFILRGIFLGSEKEYDWLYKSQGAAKFFPEYYRDFISIIPTEELTDPLSAFHQLLISENEIAAIAASKAWCLWELRLSTLEHHNIGMAQVDDLHQALCMAKISSHYFKNNCFMKPNYILDNIAKLMAIPAIIIHGRFDMVCQLYVADFLTQQWDSAQLQILPCAGHSGFERQTIDAFCQAADVMADLVEYK